MPWPSGKRLAVPKSRSLTRLLLVLLVKKQSRLTLNRPLWKKTRLRLPFLPWIRWSSTTLTIPYGRNIPDVVLSMVVAIPPVQPVLALPCRRWALGLAVTRVNAAVAGWAVMWTALQTWLADMVLETKTAKECGLKPCTRSMTTTDISDTTCVLAVADVTISVPSTFPSRNVLTS